MPSLVGLEKTSPDKFDALVTYVSQLKGLAQRECERRPPRSGTMSEPQVRAMFDRVASFYDVMNSVMTAGLHHRSRARAADLAALAPSGSTLDVACGTEDLAQ